MKTLSLLRLWSMIFPCSDFRHVVMTPVILLMSEYLMRCPILSGRDIAIGSFLCTMVLSVCLSCPSIHLYYSLYRSAWQEQSLLDCCLLLERFSTCNWWLKVPKHLQSELYYSFCPTNIGPFTNTYVFMKHQLIQ